MVLFTGLVLILAAVTGWLLGPYPTIDESRVHPSLRGLVDSTKCGWTSWGDGGIDGLKFFHDVDKAGVRKILVSVKGGSNVGLSMVKDLITTVTHNGAEIGLFVTLTPPSQPMIAEAAKAGFYTSASGEKFARLQILTIEDLMSGKARSLHPDHKPDLDFKKARREKDSEQTEFCL